VAPESNPPRAFISYSHDSPAHKDWVRALAQRLTGDGVQIGLDQWDLSLGDELTRFMERSLIEGDYVLLICAETYTKKANESAAGVGYEARMLSDLMLRRVPNQVPSYCHHPRIGQSCSNKESTAPTR
jgi:TIR domain